MGDFSRYSSTWNLFAGVNKETIMRTGALRPLIVLLGVSNSDVQCNACGCITTLATVGKKLYHWLSVDLEYQATSLLQSIEGHSRPSVSGHLSITVNRRPFQA